MKFLVRAFRHPINTLWGWLLVATFLAGCGQDDVQVYHVTKDPSSQAQSKASQNATAQSGTRATPTLEWKLPQGWEETAPGEMRFASFRVKGEEGKTADVGVFPLGMGGGDLDNVNRWRGQVGQPPITEEERAKTAIPVSIDGLPAQFYEMAGENAGSGDKTRILAGILRKEGVAWFFKMTGPDSLVAGQKTAFVQWLESLKFGTSTTPELPPSHPPIDAAAIAAQSAAAPSSSGDKPQWQVPAGWAEAPGGQFLIAKFTITGPDNSQAAVNVSMSAGDGGGLVSNVNRWRKQLGLAEIPDAEVQKITTALEGAEGGKASLVDLIGMDPRTKQKTRLLGAMVPRAGQTWYYKLMGPEQIVEREQNNFINFIKTAKYPNA